MNSKKLRLAPLNKRLAKSLLLVAPTFLQVACPWLLGVTSLLAGPNGPIPGLNTTTPYLIYYGNWNSGLVNFARSNYHLVILHLASNITADQVAAIKRGKDNLAGTADDVLVVAYLSSGEDHRIGVPFVGDRLGPRVDPRSADSEPLSSITNALGLPSAGGTGYASYYLNTKNNQTGFPDQNSSFGSYYVNASAPAWWEVIKNRILAGSGQAGLDEILTRNAGNGYDCDGVFLDTIDTAAPNTFGTSYEWTAPGMQRLVQRIRDTYPGKLLIANRGLFYFNPNLKTYLYTLRPYVDAVMFESYFTDTSSSTQITPWFSGNRFDFAPKLNAEAGRPDGFTMLALGYDKNPPLPPSVIDQDYAESMGTQGWPLYRTNPQLDTTPNTVAATWLATNADTQPPVWDSTAARDSTSPPPRVGLRQIVAGYQSATLYWDVARDQTQPVRYNLYYTALPAMNFASATKLAHVAPDIPDNYLLGAGSGSYPYSHTITGLSNGVTYLFAIRAEDSATPSHEDTNTVLLRATPTDLNSATGYYRHITIDGKFSDWAAVPWAYQASPDGNPVNFTAIQFANDTNYLYGHFTLSSPYAPFSDFNTHLFVDTDAKNQTGYPVSGTVFGSELLIESGVGYDERNGSFNAGIVPGVSWAMAPGGAATEFEFRLSLAARYAGSSVFTADSIRLLLQDNRGPEIASAGGLPYFLAKPTLSSVIATKSGNQITITWSGPGTLQSSDSISSGQWTNLVSATSPYSFEATGPQRYFRLIQ